MELKFERGDGGLGLGDGGWGIGDWPQPPIPNPQSPIPNPQSPIPNPHIFRFNFDKIKLFLIYKSFYIISLILLKNLNEFINLFQRLVIYSI